MKKIITVLLISLFFCLSTFSQERFLNRNQECYFDKNNKFHKPLLSNGARTLIILSSSIILNSVGDGLNDNGHKVAGHLCNAASIGSLLMIPIFVKTPDKKQGIAIFAGYTLLRFSLFNYGYNITRGLNPSYVGNTSYPDKFFNKYPPMINNFTKGVTLIVGVSVCFDYLN